MEILLIINDNSYAILNMNSTPDTLLYTFMHYHSFFNLYHQSEVSTIIIPILEVRNRGLKKSVSRTAASWLVSGGGWTGTQSV